MPSCLAICCGERMPQADPVWAARGVWPALDSGCNCACFKMKSVNAPGPVRSSVSKLLLPENFRSTLRAMWSHISLRDGCPGAAANVHCSTCKSRFYDHLSVLYEG